jgi:hypothetical protein
VANSPRALANKKNSDITDVSFKDSLVVALLYFLSFLILIWPVHPFGTDYWIGHSGDELQASWNMWWFRHAIVNEHSSPWFTSFIHFPLGISLLGQPLAAPHGFIYLLFAPFISLAAAYNFIAVTGFVLSGLFAYWIARDLQCTRWGSFFAGYLVTFSNFHFQHLHGHLEFVSMQWLVLFLFAFQRLVSQQSVSAAILSVVSLLLVALGNSYYLLTAGLAVCCFVGPALRRLVLHTGATRYRLWLLALTGATCTTGLYVYCFASVLHDSPLLAGHSLELGSLHPSLVFIPGQFWRWGYLTEKLWSNLPGYTFEHSVALGFGICALMLIGVLLQALKSPNLQPWAAFFCLSLLLSIGPALYVGRVWVDLPLPFDFLDMLLPFASLSGVPIRLFSGASIAAAILATRGLEKLIQSGNRKYALAGVFLCALSVIEQVPRVPDRNQWKVPAYAQALRQLPRPSGAAVIDLVSKGGDQLMAQTVHEFPILFGYSARISKRVDRQNRRFRKLLSAGRFEELCSLASIAYLIAPPDRFPNHFPADRIVYADAHSRISIPCPLVRGSSLPPGAWQQGIDSSGLK